MDYSHLKSDPNLTLSNEGLDAANKGIVYAFDGRYRGVFQNVGHIGLNQDGTVKPYILDESNHVIPI